MYHYILFFNNCFTFQVTVLLTRTTTCISKLRKKVSRDVFTSMVLMRMTRRRGTAHDRLAGGPQFSSVPLVSKGAGVRELQTCVPKVGSKLCLLLILSSNLGQSRGITGYKDLMFRELFLFQPFKSCMTVLQHVFSPSHALKALNFISHSLLLTMVIVSVKKIFEC